MQTVIELEQVAKKYRLGSVAVSALNGINLTVQDGKFYSIMGPSGSGKSSLLHILGCLDQPSAGQIRWQGREIAHAPEKQLVEIRNQAIGFVFQNFQLNPILNCLENVAIALRVQGIRPGAARARAKTCLSELGLGDRLYHYPNELSGGQKQRVAIARALVKQPKLILADEPTGNLDSIAGQIVVDLLKKFNRELGGTLIVVTHNQEVADQADEILRLKDGCLIESTQPGRGGDGHDLPSAR